MRRPPLHAGLASHAGLAGLTALLVLCACGDDSSSSGTQSVSDSGSSLPDAQNAPDSGVTSDEAGEDHDAAAPPAQVSFRIAHLSPDAPPFDVCLAPHATTDDEGPFLHAFAAAAAAANGTPFPDDSGAATGLVYGQVSAYFKVEPGTYEVRLVAAGATSCDTPLGALPTSLVDGGAAIEATIPSVSVADPFTTLLVAGEASPTGTDPSLTVAPIGDDSVLVSGGAALRAVNALASGVSQDFGFGAFDAGYLPVFADVAFAQAASHVSPDEAKLDGNGYLTVGEQDGVSFSARASTGATADTVATQSLQIDLGAITTVIAIGGDSAGKAPAQLLLCVDNWPSGGALSDCSVLP